MVTDSIVFLEKGENRRSFMIRKGIKLIVRLILVLVCIAVLAGGIGYQRYAGKMKKMTLEERLQSALDSMTDGTQVHGSVFQVYRGSDGFTWTGTTGELKAETQYSIASITKMYTAAVTMKLIEQGVINWDDPIANYLPSEIMTNLHVYEETDYSNDITIRHLLTHTSGLPDYFTESVEGEASIAEIRKTDDVAYGVGEAVKRAKKLTPHFAPGSEGQAYYADTNYQILGVLLEQVTKRPLSDVYKDYIFAPLGLEHTYLKIDKKLWGIAPIYNGEDEIRVPAIVASEWSAGGIVSTAGENMTFLKAFFAGQLFPKEYLEQMEQWKEIFSPMEYGAGLMKCSIPIPIIKLTKYDIIGHSGSTGTAAYYCPAQDIYITGTTQQLDNAKAMETVYRLLFSFHFEEKEKKEKE